MFMLPHLASLSLSEGASLVALVGAVVTGIIMVKKVGPEKDSLFISSAQGAAVIMDNLIDTLRQEVDRCRARIEALEAEAVRLLAENARLADENEGLEAEVAGLRLQSGRRRGEGHG